MLNNKDIFFEKKILIYGLGKSGLSSYNFLKKQNEVYLYDDKNIKIKKKLISYKTIIKKKFDYIIISPGINIETCKLNKFLKKNLDKINTDLDIFYSLHNKNKIITITGTNGKSTTAQIIYEILRKKKVDVRLAGNIGNPILLERNIKNKTIFVIEASSYQLEYSKIFKSKYALILNLSPDHIERHKTMNNYVKAKFKLLKNQLKGHYAFVKKNDLFIKKELKLSKFESKIIRVDTKKNNILKNIHNNYFLTETNKENLLFALEISKKFNLKNNLLLKTIQNFKGLKYRQQIIFRKNNLTIINDSKSTSFSSSIGVLKVNPNIYWLLGGIYKKGDKFNLPKKYFNNISAFIYGKNKKFFNQKLKGKIKYENFNNVKDGLKKIFMMIKNKKSSNQTILFSPSAASFDSFKNFEDRGYYFNKLVKKYLNVL